MITLIEVSQGVLDVCICWVFLVYLLERFASTCSNLTSRDGHGSIFLASKRDIDQCFELGLGHCMVLGLCEQPCGHAAD